NYPTARYSTTKVANSSGGFPIVWFWESGDPLGLYRIRYTDPTGKVVDLTFRIRTAPGAPGTPTCTADDGGSVSANWSVAAPNGAAVTYEVRHKEVATGTVS